MARIGGLVLRIAVRPGAGAHDHAGDFGLIGMAAVFTNFTAIFMDVGLSQAAIQREVNHRQIDPVLDQRRLGVMIAAVFRGGGAADRDVLQDAAAGDHHPGAGAELHFGDQVSSTPRCSRATCAYSCSRSRKIGSSTSGVAVAVVVAKMGMGYWALVGLALAPAIVKTAILWMALRWVPSLPSRGTGVRSMLRFGGDVAGLQCGELLLARLTAS